MSNYFVLLPPFALPPCSYPWSLEIPGAQPEPTLTSEGWNSPGQKGSLGGATCLTLLVYCGLMWFYGVTFLIRLVEPATLFATFEEACVIRVVLDKWFPWEARISGRRDSFHGNSRCVRRAYRRKSSCRCGVGCTSVFVCALASQFAPNFQTKILLNPG